MKKLLFSVFLALACSAFGQSANTPVYKLTFQGDGTPQTTSATNVAPTGGSAHEVLNQKLSQQMGAPDFGTVANSKSTQTNIYVTGVDCTAALQLAILSCITNGAQSLKLTSGNYLITTNNPYFPNQGLVIPRRDAAFAALGAVDNDTNDTGLVGWNSYPRFRMYGDGWGSKLIANFPGAVITMTGQTNSANANYTTRAIAVELDHFSVSQFSADPASRCVVCYNTGITSIHDFEINSDGGNGIPGCYIGLELESLSELEIYNSYIHNCSFGIWTEQGTNSWNINGDIGSVWIHDNTIWNNANASIAAHYFRHLSISHNELTGNGATIAGLWISGISPTLNGILECSENYMENSSQGGSGYGASILLGATTVQTNGLLGLQYPLTMSVTNLQGARFLDIVDNTFGFSPGGSNIVWDYYPATNSFLSRNNFLPANTNSLVFTPKFQVGQRIDFRDNQPNLFTSSVDMRTAYDQSTTIQMMSGVQNMGWINNITNAYWSLNSYTTNVPFMGGYSQYLPTNGSLYSYILLQTSHTPSGINAAKDFYIEYWVNYTNVTFAGNAIKLYNTTNGARVPLYTRGSTAAGSQVVTNSQGVAFSRYAAVVRARAGEYFDAIYFGNDDSTNNVPILGSLIYGGQDSGNDSGSQFIYAKNMGIGGTNNAYPLYVSVPQATVGWLESRGSNNVSFAMNNQAGGFQDNFTLWDAGTLKWIFGKQTDNSYFIFDQNTSKLAFTISTADVIGGNGAGLTNVLATAAGTTTLALGATGLNWTNAVGTVTAVTNFTILGPDGFTWKIMAVR